MSGLDLSGYRLTFTDEFNDFDWNSQGSSSVTPDRTPTGTWTTHYWWGAGDRTLYGNNEQQYYSDASTAVNPFTVEDGSLVIHAAPSADPDATGGLPYTSGLITTEGSFAQTYGYFEMRAELPWGQGLWPAFWMLAQDHTWPPELDIIEAVGKDHEVAHTTVISGESGSPVGNGTGTTIPGLDTGYHTFGALWTAETITFYVDGAEIFEAATPSDMHKPMYLLANLAVGGNWPGSPDETTQFPAEMKIDYIRAYALDPSIPPVEPDDGGGAAQPASRTVGAGPDSLVLRISQDYWLADATYTVAVDGKQVGDTFTASARHDSGEPDTLTVKGDFGPGPHTVTVAFTNDAYGGTPDTDRNLHVEGISLNGVALADGAATLYGGSQDFAFAMPDDGGEAEQPTGPTVGAGPDSLVLRISQDYWLADATYTVAVDGKQVGDTFTASARHGSDEADTLTVRGDFGPGPHTVTVAFTNDAYGGTPDTDRNLHVEGISLNGVALADGAATLLGGSQDFAFDMPDDGGKAEQPEGPAVGAGPDSLVLAISQDYWLADATYTIAVDGVQVGGTFTASARHGSGEPDTLTVKGDYGSGPHTVTIAFTNDAYGGTPDTDRNLHVEGISLNGVALADGAATLYGGSHDFVFG